MRRNQSFAVLCGPECVGVESMMSSRLRVAIIFGGQSAEHEISILSARNVLAALDRKRFEPVLIGIDKAGRWLEQPAQLLESAHDARRVHIASDGPPAHLA